MRIVLVNKSDTRGGAAVVSRRLMHALRDEGVDARMLVAERFSDDPYVVAAASPLRTKIPFLLERLEVFAANGGNRATLFKIDTASRGLPLWKHPLIKDADAVILNWVNQGMLSLEGVNRIAAAKPLIWTMHDMWCATGICHHTGLCSRFETECRLCPLLGDKASANDISCKIWQRKKLSYGRQPIHFVAVSNWLAERCRLSSLLHDKDLSVIPNPFILKEKVSVDSKASDGTIRAVMAAARLDDDVKGFPILIKALQKLSERNMEIARRLHIILCGDIREKSLLQQIPVSWEWKGSLPPEAMQEIFSSSHLVLSPSRYETLPGTLVEAQAFGAVPVAFDRGGQRDIIDHGLTGFLSPFGSDDTQAAENFADLLVEAVRFIQSVNYKEIINTMYSSVHSNFAPSAVAGRYIGLVRSMIDRRNAKS